MKKLAATLCIIGSAFALSACSTEGSGDVQTGAPYELERTAGSNQEPAVSRPAPRRAERTFQEQQRK